MTGFTFNGTTSQSLGLLVTALNPYNSAMRRVETIEIPYRNGNLIIDSGTYDNIMVSYEVSIIGNTKATCDAVNEWLSGSQGYCILSDTVNTEFFRVGYLASSIEYVLTALYKEGKATLNFDCFPQKYLNTNTTITRSATSTTETDVLGASFSSHVYPLPIELKGNTTQDATPTPTSPIPVNVVSGDNEINICGKNLFDKDNIISGYRLDGSGNPSSIANNEFTSDFIPVESGTTYIRSYGNISAYTRTCFYDKNKSFVSKNDDSQSFTIPSNVKYIRFSEYLTKLNTMQLETGNTATEYEEYKGIIYHFSLPVELNKIGTYQDYFYKDNSKWYLHKEIAKYIFTGNETGVLQNSGKRFDITCSTNNMPICINNSTSSEISQIYCNILPASSSASTWGGNQGISYNTGTNGQILVSISGVTTMQAYLSALKDNYCYYILATPTNTEITDATLISQLNALDSATTFETSTTIAQVNNDAPFLLTYTNIGSSNFSSNYRGEPIITVNDTGYIYINGASIKVNQVPMTINSQTMQAYNGSINLNNYVELNEFPMLKKGNNDIGSTMALSIVPNYWKL